ncbi:TetR/AcrR family transcriptional regulator C-terminal domain-containing protein [Streptomyces sp. NPDC059649]|uniref:TetR/AcrR family transcriptional regulator C-terminal domain-containing protein n=1 Tax=Streptomyces sp. NPDC059649 TaxID=3346895 RepID=UPI003685BFEF
MYPAPPPLSAKETLYRETVEAAADRIGAQYLAMVEQLREATADDDPRAPLTAAARCLLQAFSAEDAHAVRQLASAQAAPFPDLAASVRERTSLRVRSALADRLTRLILTRRLRASDPELAAEHFLSLLTGPPEYRPDADPDTVADTATDVFLRAYGR